MLNLPRLVAEGAGAFAAGGPPAARAQRALLGAAVGGPILAALQDTLCDVDVVTLVREAVAQRVQRAVARAVGAAADDAGGGGGAGGQGGGSAAPEEAPSHAQELAQEG